MGWLVTMTGRVTPVMVNITRGENKVLFMGEQAILYV